MQNKHLVLEQDDHVHNDSDDGDDNSVGNGDGGGAADGAEDGADGAEKHLVHLSQVADCYQTEISEQTEHLVTNEDNDVHNDADDVHNDSVGNGDDGGADDGAD
eukprot:14584619-Ditylum_brightwellii.AAC.1